jgi:oxalate decarboxylase
MSNDPIPQPKQDKKGGVDRGPRNLELDRQNPDLLSPPSTDHGTVPNLKFSFSMVHTRMEEGGWTRQVTQRELPVATEMAGVEFGLEPGGYREVHWHTSSEWAYVLKGSCRIGAVDQEGRNFLEDVKEGDLWFFPKGVPHYIQALEDGVDFLLVFNDGNFSEDDTFMISDWFSRTPKSVLAKNFGWSPEQVDLMPDYNKYIFQGQLPPPLAQDRVVSPTGDVPRSFKHRMLAQVPQQFRGGTVRVTDSSNFTAADTICAALVEVKPGGMRELHWHPTDDEWQYYISGQGRMGVFANSGVARTFDYQSGDVGYVPFAYGHYVQNTGTQPLVFLEMFRTSRYADISATQWMANLPPHVMAETLNVPQCLIAALPKDKQSVI